MRTFDHLREAALGVLLLACAGNPKPRVTGELLARRPVCLAVDWLPDTRATFAGRPAPDTLVLLPDPGDGGVEENVEAWGIIDLAVSQQERSGGGWWWSLARDTLMLKGENPTMDGLVLWLVKPDERQHATWREFGLTAFEDSKTGRVDLHPCRGRG